MPTHSNRVAFLGISETSGAILEISMSTKQNTYHLLLNHTLLYNEQYCHGDLLYLLWLNKPVYYTTLYMKYFYHTVFPKISPHFKLLPPLKCRCTFWATLPNKCRPQNVAVYMYMW